MKMMLMMMIMIMMMMMMMIEIVIVTYLGFGRCTWSDVTRFIELAGIVPGWFRVYGLGGRDYGNRTCVARPCEMPVENLLFGFKVESLGGNTCTRKSSKCCASDAADATATTCVPTANSCCCIAADTRGDVVARVKTLICLPAGCMTTSLASKSNRLKHCVLDAVPLKSKLTS